MKSTEYSPVNEWNEDPNRFNGPLGDIRRSVVPGSTKSPVTDPPLPSSPTEDLPLDDEG